MMEREGRALRELPKGDRRRMADAKNAIRKMTDEQRRALAAWIVDEHPGLANAITVERLTPKTS